jgi:chromosome segregation protein
MFGGGRAELRIVSFKKQKGESADEEDYGSEEKESEIAEERGVEISVSLPRKRIQTMAMLSGGERALTSIALLFAMSQVNPPPFLVLDETDAALDESNSSKYGKMLEELSKQIQLIVITHNRETMKEAGVLYGVTMGADSISKLLSVQLNDTK